MAPKKKAKTGGRVRGTPNRSTVERAERAARDIVEARAAGKRLAKEVLDEFMHLFAGMAATYQPPPPGQVNANEDLEKFDKYAVLAVDCARKLAPYQSPTFQAIMVAPAPDQNQPEQRKRFTLTIFEGARPALELAPPQRANRGETS